MGALRGCRRAAHHLRSYPAAGRRQCSSSSAPKHDVSEQLRQVMRDVPQAVAIAVTRVPNPEPGASRYHGVTLSSFTSLTLHPHPLVAFSLRLPSRMAEYLRACIPQSTHDIPSSAPDHSASKSPPLTISVLSIPQAPLAQSLSHTRSDQSSIFNSPSFDDSNPPAVTDSIGSLRCEVVSSLLLREVCPADVAVDGKGTEEMCGNELFICRVVSVENGSGEGKEKPLMYWRQRYVGV